MKILGGILLLGLFVLLAWLLIEFYLFFTEADKEIKAALIGIFGITIAAIFSHHFSQKREISSRHFAQKVKAYEGVFNLIFEIMQGIHNKAEMTEEEMLKKTMKIKKDLMIWAGTDVIKAWSEFELDSTKGENANPFKSMEAIFRSLRKELGHSDTSLEKGTFVKWLVKVEDHCQVDNQMSKIT